MDLDFCKEFIQPELLALVPALNFLGTVLKRSASVPDKNIPLLLGGAGVLLSAVWVVGQNAPGTSPRCWPPFLPLWSRGCSARRAASICTS